jgi:hypothetical protein
MPGQLPLFETPLLCKNLIHNMKSIKTIKLKKPMSLARFARDRREGLKTLPD